MKRILSHLLSHFPAHLSWVWPIVSYLTPSIRAYDDSHPGATYAQLGAIFLSLIARYVSPKAGKAAMIFLALSLAIPASAMAQADPVDPVPPGLAGSCEMEHCATVSVPMVRAQSATAAAPAVSAAPSNIYAGGVSWNQSAVPAVAGSALYARALDSASGTYAFTVVDLLPNTTKPFTVTSNVSVGVAQKIFSLGKVPIFVPTSAGVSFSGSNTGWAWSTGGMADIKLGKKSNWRVFPMVRVARSNVSGSGMQPIVGVMVGWGQ